jgi:hypothetical protein
MIGALSLFPPKITSNSILKKLILTSFLRKRMISLGSGEEEGE